MEQECLAHPAASGPICHMPLGGVRQPGPPANAERPAKTLMAYGFSITQGCFAQNNSLSYVQYAAMRLGWDVLNFGLSGACYCERETADFLAEIEDWDAAMLEVGVNMREFFTVEEFKERAGYLVDTVCRRHPEKPVFLVTVYPNIKHFQQGDSIFMEREKGYNQFLRDVVSSGRYPELHLIEGKEILDQPDYLGADLLHPTDYGHIRMGENLAAHLKPVLDGR